MGSLPNEKRWIAVDLDSTLAEHHWEGFDPRKIGQPIPKMVKRVKKWLAMGYKVSILTARLHPYWDEGERREVETLIKGWCKEHLGQELEVDCSKHPAMDQIYDDRAVTVEANTGRILTIGKEDEGDAIGTFVSGG